MSTEATQRNLAGHDEDGPGSQFPQQFLGQQSTCRELGTREGLQEQLLRLTFSGGLTSVSPHPQFSYHTLEQTATQQRLRASLGTPTKTLLVLTGGSTVWQRHPRQNPRTRLSAHIWLCDSLLLSGLSRPQPRSQGLDQTILRCHPARGYVLF